VYFHVQVAYNMSYGYMMFIRAIAVFAFLSPHYMEMIQLLSVFQDIAYINTFYFMLSGPGVLFTFVM
jgi:hypothetical protein